MNQNENIPDGTGKIFRNPDVVEVASVHGNTAQEIVTTTVDRLRLRLVEHSDTIQKKYAWWTPLGIFLSVGVSLSTAEFKKFVFEGSIWKAIFIVAAVLSFCWFVREVWRALNAPSIDDLIEAIKSQETHPVAKKTFRSRWWKWLSRCQVCTHRDRANPR